MGAREPRVPGRAVAAGGHVSVRGYSIPRTPEGRSSLVPHPPWHYVGDFLVIEYWADPERAVSFLPEGLDPHPDPGRCAAVFADWQSCSAAGGELLDPSRSQYKECFIVVNALLGGEEVTTCPVHLGRSRLRARARLAAGLSEEARLDLDHAHVRPRQPRRPGSAPGRGIRRHVRRLRASRRPGHRDARAPLRGRPDAQRSADRQRPPLPAARSGPSRRSGRARARCARAAATARSRRSGRAARRSSSSVLRTRSTTRSRPSRSARASGSRSATRSTTRRS